MKLEGENVLVRIFLDVFQQWRHRPLYEVLVETARNHNMRGATVLEGIEGFGQKGPVLKENFWRVSNNREVIVELVDCRERIDSFLNLIEPMLQDAIVTQERAHVILYRRQGDSFS